MSFQYVFRTGDRMRFVNVDDGGFSGAEFIDIVFGRGWAEWRVLNISANIGSHTIRRIIGGSYSIITGYISFVIQILRTFGKRFL